MTGKLKIGILGSRGIPNAYGGFEQFAESLALYLVKNNHDVTVYNSSLHPNQEKTWNGIKIQHCFDPEEKIGTVGQFIYDLNCIRHSRKASFDILLQLGYTSSAVWSFMLPKKSIIVTNMDGLEWKRTKYSSKVQKFLKWSEKRAANTSDQLVADSIGIKNYLKSELGRDSEYIAYGAKTFENPNPSVLEKYGLKKSKYHILIARMEPENNIETILQGFVKSNSDLPFVIVGNTNKKFGQYIRSKFQSDRVLFTEGIYNQEDLNNLRYFSNTYFHGHSVGGTNPSLLEAMASSSFICAHDNIFNKSILGHDALYFSSDEDIAVYLNSTHPMRENMIKSNLQKIRSDYNEEKINRAYETLFLSLCN